MRLSLRIAALSYVTPGINSDMVSRSWQTYFRIGKLHFGTMVSIGFRTDAASNWSMILLFEVIEFDKKEMLPLRGTL